MNRDYCPTRASPFPPAERCSLPRSMQVFHLRSDIYAVWQEAEASCEIRCLPAQNSLVLPLRIENDFSSPPEVVTFKINTSKTTREESAVREVIFTWRKVAIERIGWRLGFRGLYMAPHCEGKRGSWGAGCRDGGSLRRTGTSRVLLCPGDTGLTLLPLKPAPLRGSAGSRPEEGSPGTC